jgi:hypothetical protein
LSPSGPNTNDGPATGEVEQAVDHALAERRSKSVLAGRRLEHEQREEHLQRQAPGHRLAIDRAAVVRRAAKAISRMTSRPTNDCTLGAAAT